VYYTCRVVYETIILSVCLDAGWRLGLWAMGMAHGLWAVGPGGGAPLYALKSNMFLNYTPRF
jgi:hypothetical protein